MTQIRLRNSMTRKVEPFEPIDRENIRLYLCGPTVYDRAHLGNARPSIMFDVLFRLLSHEFGADHVTYVRNFTDIDDKINARSAASGRSIGEITDETIGWYHEDMDALGILRPTHEPRATQYISQMIEMIEGLIASGHAYAAEGHALFAVDSYSDYGKLSGRSVDDMIAGARVEVAPYKRNPMDFVLWKPSDADQPGWESPWGYGRPGWHIECSAMAHDLLGAHFDIHGGGNDLMFPHHENEIAQSCCAHKGAGFANIWLHNEMLQVEGKKMSKSLGNFFTVRDLLDQGVAGEVIRFVMLSTHYSKPMDWTAQKAEEATKVLRKWAGIVQGVRAGAMPVEVLTELGNDLNSAGVIAELHKLARAGDAGGLRAGLDLLGFGNLAELAQMPETGFSDAAGFEAKLLALRAEAMESKDFSQLDALKSALTEAGLEVRMSKAGVELVPTPAFNPSKLEGLL
ncbi:cysteine--tRNA ligase [Rhodophyticola sp. SM2404]